MTVRAARVAVIALAAAYLSTSCTNPFAPQYEYEEQVYLQVDGRASVVIDTSFDALVALRGAGLDPLIASSADRSAVRTIVTAAGCEVTNVSRFWTRHGRRFVQIEVAVANVKDLPSCKLLSWSTYSLEPIATKPDQLRFQQQVGEPAPGPDAGKASWSGNELVAFKAHLPSRITDHNVKLLDGTNGTIDRGNILTWEQKLTDRLAAKPLAMRADMEATSILHTTLWLFAGAFAGAVAVLVLIIWWVVRKGRKAAIRRP